MQEEAAIDRAWWAMLSSKCRCIDKGRLLVFSFSGGPAAAILTPGQSSIGLVRATGAKKGSTCKRYSTITRTIMTRRGTVRFTDASRVYDSLLQRRHVKSWLHSPWQHRMSARRAYGNIAAGSKILSNPEIMGSSDNVMMWSRCVRRSSSSSDG